jgi:acyl dehydratase
MHTDPVKAAAGPHKGLIASGWHTSALMMKLFVENFLSKVANLPSPGVDEVRWLKPVRPGDQLVLRVTIVETRPSRSKPDRGMIFCRLEAISQDGMVVCTMRTMNMMLKRNS